MASTSKAGKGSWTGANGATSAGEGGSAEPQPSTSRRRERTNQSDVYDIFISKNRPLVTALAEPPVGLPKDRKYKLVACELGTTGRRLIDEKIKADTEISVIIRFLVWLASLKSPEEQLILLYHDPQRLMPIMLMQSILRFNLMPRFQSLVAGFSDNYALCHATCGKALKTLAVTPMANVLLDEGSHSTRTSVDRSKAIYDILEQLTIQGIEMRRLKDIVIAIQDFDEDAIEIESVMIQLACSYGRPVHTEIEALRHLRELLQKQNTFREIFGPMLRQGPVKERRPLTQLRRVLVDAGLLYDQVKDAWHDDKAAGLLNLFTPLKEIIKKEEISRLVSIFVNFFDVPAAPAASASGKSENSQQTEEIDELEFTGELEDLYESEVESSSPGGAGAFAVGEDCLDD